MTPIELAIGCAATLCLLLAMNRAGPVACRLCLLVGITSLVATGLVLAAAFIRSEPGCLILFVLVAFGAFLRGGVKGTGWLFGTSRWASVGSDLLPAGMLNNRGVPLGQAEAPKLSAAYRALIWAPWRDSLAASLTFFAALKKTRVWVSCDRAVNTVVVCPAGRGKSTSIAIPMLQTNPDSAIVIDVKGELLLPSVEHRRRMGHEVRALAPFGLDGMLSDTLNVLDLIDPKAPDALDLCRALAESLVVRTGQEKEPHWLDSAEMFIAAVIALVILEMEPDERNLQTVVAVLASDEGREEAIKAMRASTAWDGLLARMGDQLAQFTDKELASVMTTVARTLRCLSTPPVVTSTSSSSFDPRRLLTGSMTIHLVLPPHFLNSHSGLMRLWVTSLLSLLPRSGLTQNKRVWLIADEAASLQRLEAIESAITQLRGYGLRCVFFYQSVAQLEKCFPEGQSQTFLSNMDLRVYFGVNDHATAQSVSDQCGDCTLLQRSASGGTGSSYNRDAHGLPTSGTSSNSNWSAQEVGRKLLQPAEVMQLPERTAVVFAPGVPPCTIQLVRHYERAMQDRLKQPSMLALAARSLCLGISGVALFIAMICALLASQRPAQAAPKPVPVQPAPSVPPNPIVRPRPDIKPGVYTI